MSTVTEHLKSRPSSTLVDRAFVAIEVLGILGCLAAIVLGLPGARADVTGLGAFPIILGVATLVFLVPAAVCTISGLRTGRRGLVQVGQGLVVAVFCGGPLALMVGFALILSI